MSQITTPVKNIVAAVQEIAWIVVPLLFVGVLFHAHHRGGIDMAVIMELVGLVLIAAIVVYASDIITWIKPGQAAASVRVPSAEASLLVWQVFGGQWLILAALTWGIRRVRYARWL